MPEIKNLNPLHDGDFYAEVDFECLNKTELSDLTVYSCDGKCAEFIISPTLVKGRMEMQLILQK